MNIGQLLSQVSIGVGLETTLPLLDESMNIESQALNASPFRDVLRDISSHGNSPVRIMQGGVKIQQLAGDVTAESNARPDQQIDTTLVGMKQLFSIVPEVEMAGVLETTVAEIIPENPDNQQLMDLQNLVMSSSGAQLVPLPRMPEPQIADQKIMTTSDVSPSVSNVSKEFTAAVAQKTPDLSPRPEAVVRPPVPVSSGQQSEVTMVVANAPVLEAAPVSKPAVVVPVATPAESGEKYNTRRSEMPAPSVLASEVHADRTEPVLNAYYQTSSRPTTVLPNAIQPLAVADGRTSQLTVPAPAPPVATQAVTNENPPAAILAPLVSSLTPAAPVAAESSESVIPVTVTQTDVSVPRVTASPAEVSLVNPVTVKAEAVMVASDSPASRPAAFVPDVVPAASGEYSNIRRSVAPESPRPTELPVSAPEVPVNRTEPVLNAYYQTSSRPFTVASPATQPIAAEDGRTLLRPTETAATLISTNAVKNESTTIGAFVAPFSRSAPAVPVAAYLAETATPATDTQSFVAVSGVTELPSANDMPEFSTISRPVPVMPDVQANLAKPVLDASYQVPSRPFTEMAPATQSSAAADISALQLIGTTASSPSVASSEITPANTLAPLVNLRTTAESSASAAPAVLGTQVAPVLSAVAELQEPDITASVLPQVSSAVRGTVVPLRNPDKVVQDAGPLRQGLVGENWVSEQVATVTPGSVKAPSTLDSGENLPGNGNNGNERSLNGQAHLLFQPSKAEQSTVIANPIAADVREALTKESMEHVVQQVKEHLAGRDFKTGTDQVTIRLTPEHMGELKLNLRMENQQLKVEIVAENASVRDALLKHSDSLRETLAKQNISMESFDVTTGGKGSGNQGHNQSAWREMAKQQQQQPYWASARGYNIAQADIPSGHAAYQRQQGHSMLDIHY